MRCSACNARYADDGTRLSCDRPHEPSLLVTEYRERRLAPDPTAPGLFRYRCWLPCSRGLDGGGGSVTYRSEGLGRRLGLNNLWVAFNGWWPERGAELETATFKELEAWTVLARLGRRNLGVLVVASAGNTAAAFARACGVAGVPCVIVVPESGLRSLALARCSNSCVKVVVLKAPADYTDAIELARRVAALDGFLAEGGTMNVGRRDGLGTVLLRAVETMGQLPELYFQAVGSGAGAIATDEAARRLTEDGRFGVTRPKLMLSQNEPFAPMAAAWRMGQRDLPPYPANARELISRMAAPVLSNRRPVYSHAGGVLDAVSATGGEISSVTNAEVRKAQRLFQEAEGVDIAPAAGVALASLRTAVRKGQIEPDSVVLLNVTGGGGERRRRETQPVTSEPSLWVRADKTDEDGVAESVARLFTSSRLQRRASAAGR
jgi:cysteate synthase